MFAVICFDRPDSARLRDANRARHLEHLEANLDKIAFAGPLKNDEDGPSVGTLIVLDVGDRAAAEAIAHADPFYEAGVFESVVIRPFKKVFPRA